jgi:hypothetical protein
VAQATRRYRNSYYDTQAPAAEPADEEQPRTYSRRGEEDVRDYYQLQQTPAPRRRWPFGSYYDTPQYNNQTPQPFWRRQRATPQPVEEQTPAPRLRPAPDGDTPTPDETNSDAQPTPQSGGKTRRSIDEDILTTSQETQMASVTPAPRTRETTTVRTSNLPRDWESFVKAAVRLTNHSAGVYGYAPVIFAEGGGREFSQWGVQAGLRIAYPEGERIALDVNSRAAADVVQFIKDLTWRYDVTPPLDKCYADNVIRMFAEGRVGMTMLPANRDTIRRLLRLGMPLDAIGIAPLPSGPKGRRHLTFGRCLVVNPQLDKDKRAAAVKWLLFQLDPETIRMREQFYYREQEMTGAPRVPLFLRARREAMAAALKPYRTLPTYADYEDAIAPLLQPEPGYFTDQLYSAIADGIRPLVTRKDSDPVAEIGSVGLEFERKFLRDAPTPKGLQRYLQRFVELAGR